MPCIIICKAVYLHMYIYASAYPSVREKDTRKNTKEYEENQGSKCIRKSLYNFVHLKRRTETYLSIILGAGMDRW